MAMRGGPRVAVGSEAWVTEHRSHALDVARQEAEEFSFSARNELDWLNEHMAEIFSENQVPVAELFKTPGKLRGKTPRTVRRTNLDGVRAPLSNLFSATPKGAPSHFAISSLSQQQKSKIKIAGDRSTASSPKPASPAKQIASARQQGKPPAPVSAADSGYYGSQPQDMVAYDRIHADDAPSHKINALDNVQTLDFAASPTRTVAPAAEASPTRVSMAQTFESAKEEQTRLVTANVLAKQLPPPPSPTKAEAQQVAGLQKSPDKTDALAALDKSPMKTTTPFGSPAKRSASPVSAKEEPAPPEDVADDVSETMDDMRSPSDDSSPVRHPVRNTRSSFNLPSLPAREPLASKKSIGPRDSSRISHLDQTRTSYYPRQTGGKSLGGNAALEPQDENEDEDEDVDAMDVDDTTDTAIRKEKVDAKVAIAAHNKTYTQRLQDQISKLGQSQHPSRPSKSLAHLLPPQQPVTALQSQPLPPPQPQPVVVAKHTSPARDKQSISAPGAFPEDEDDEDDWIEPPATQRKAAVASPRPALPPKSHTADVMEGVFDKQTIGGSQFALPKSRPTTSPTKPADVGPQRVPGTPGHSKSASVPSLPNMAAAAAAYAEAASPRKPISVSNPSLHSLAEDESTPQSPPKSPSRTLRDSPLKHVKDKLSSILGKSKGLLANSAALSAEAKSSLLLSSPSMTRLPGPSTESFRSVKTADDAPYPELPLQTTASVPSAPPSPTRAPRRTRASIEREKRDAKEKEREEKERKKMEKQLEQARQKEAERARVFSKEQEKIAEMEKRVAEVKEQQKAPPRAEAVTPAPPPKSPPKPTRSSPRRAKPETEEHQPSAPDARLADDDVDMVEPSAVVPPPQGPRAVAATPAAARGQGLKRPMKPTQVRQEPTVIRFKPGSTQQSQYHPSTRALASNLTETLGAPQQPQHAPQRPPVTKPVPPSLKKKTSTSSFTSSVGPSGRPKALDLAAKKREEEEQAAQRRRDLKQANERKRQEEKRQEEQRRVEAERVRRQQEEEERKQAERAKKQAMIEKAKRTPAPPPAARTQPNGPPEYGMADKGPSRPPSRLGSMIPQESSRPVNSMLQSKMGGGPKRQLPQESAQPKEKRLKPSLDFDDDFDAADSQPRIKGPPVRPSGGFKKELPKPTFNHGYAPAHSSSVSVDLFKKTLTSQVAAGAGHPLNTAQFSKGQIPGIGPAAGPSSMQQHKTPARQPLTAGMKSAATSVAKSSPFGKQGDDISLPDINSDEEDDDDSYASHQNPNSHGLMADWANSPDLRRLLYEQERVDPFDVFGPPAPIVMEEIFAQPRKGQGPHRFRARTSSANWSGQDRLTEEECLRDNLARERMMREGKWSHDMVRDGLA